MIVISSRQWKRINPKSAFHDEDSMALDLLQKIPTLKVHNVIFEFTEFKISTKLEIAENVFSIFRN